MLTNLGVALSNLGARDEALAYARRAVELRPEWATAHHNLGMVLGRRGETDAALAAYEQVLRIEPEYAEAHRNRALAWLTRGDFARGWPEYEWRWRCRGLERGPFRFTQPCWQGEDLKGRTILLHAEQGLGDTLQFIRYASLVKRRGGRVVLVCPPPLVRLLAGCSSIDHVLAAGSGASQGLPAFDVHAPLMSLPLIFGTTLDDVPAEVPYLSATPASLERWRSALDEVTGFRVGIAWQGNRRHRNDRLRSFPMAALAPLARVASARLISLQRGAGTEQVGTGDGAFTVLDLDSASGLQTADDRDFLETAAIVSQLDLVVTADTALAHLAGALGVPVWVALPDVADWRWLTDRGDSPWYPTMRLFRQDRPGDWAGVFDRMAEALETAISTGSALP